MYQRRFMVQRALQSPKMTDNVSILNRLADQFDSVLKCPLSINNNAIKDCNR